MREKNWFFGLVMLASLTVASGAFGTDIWDRISADVTARKAYEKVPTGENATWIKPGNRLPTNENPECGKYGDLFRFSFAIAGEHNFLHLLDPATTLQSVVADWKKIADGLTKNDYPDTPTWSLGAAKTKLDEIIAELAKGGDIKFSDYLKVHDSYPDVRKLLTDFRNVFAPGLGCIGLNTQAEINKLAVLLGDGGLLLPLKESGIGDMTLTQLYHTPAVSRDMAGTGPYISDMTISIVAQAQEIGLLVVPKECGSNEARAAVVPSCCCNNVNHGAKYRTCTPLTGGGTNCNTCGTACCLAGVTWCIAGHAVH